MKPLFKYIIPENKTDGHIHLFNQSTQISLPKNYDYDIMVGFMDIEFDKDNINAVRMYDEFFKRYDPNKHIILATGKSKEEIFEVFEAHKDKISGFGELKMYDEYMGEKVSYKKISFLRDICGFSRKHGCLPIYIHWELSDKKSSNQLENILTNFPDIPIVLCHCGLSDDNKEFSFAQAIKLYNNYSNLWMDISYNALEYLHNNLMLIFNLNKDRIILGTDLNIKITKDKNKHKIAPILAKVEDLRNYINTDFNIKKLFKRA